MTRPRRLSPTVCAFHLGFGLVAAWNYCGWGDIVRDRVILSSLPVPEGADRIGLNSRGEETDDNPFTPAVRWVTRATYHAPGFTGEEILDFYRLRLEPEWEFCSYDSITSSPSEKQDW